MVFKMNILFKQGVSLCLPYGKQEGYAFSVFNELGLVQTRATNLGLQTKFEFMLLLLYNNFRISKEVVRLCKVKRLLKLHPAKKRFGHGILY